jgi:hypothetical protein
MDAVEHSIIKWEGLSEAQLRKHGLERRDRAIGQIVEGFTAAFDIDWESCALCYWYSCDRCVGAKANGKTCDDAYFQWLDTGDNRPMLRWLRKALK